MPVPMTRPIARNAIQQEPVGTLARPTGAAALTLPPSHGTTLPRGAGTLHTVKNPTHQVPVTPRVAPAAVA